ncbi:MAG: hypothetical protein NZ955_04960 [Candidatus Bathyarchaeota archaeon]|nr:hypothetical protein [Candidatus Bathyarchaeota archaeon]MCX8162851.1 hypothetical protein [Candidatus Bathyarchaeota archaeon]
MEEIEGFEIITRMNIYPENVRLAYSVGIFTLFSRYARIDLLGIRYSYRILE